MSTSTWIFANPGSWAWWGGLWADRVELSSFAEQSIAYGLAAPDDLAAMAAAWRQWPPSPPVSSPCSTP